MNRGPPDTIFVQMLLLWGTSQRIPGGHKAKLGGEFSLFFWFFIPMWGFFSHSFCVSWFALGVFARVWQEDLSFSALVQLFDPLLSPRCYAVVGLKSREERNSRWLISTWLQHTAWEAVIIHDCISNHTRVIVFWMFSLLIGSIVCMISSKCCNLCIPVILVFLANMLFCFIYFTVFDETNKPPSFWAVSPWLCACSWKHLEKLSVPVDCIHCSLLSFTIRESWENTCF